MKNPVYIHGTRYKTRTLESILDKLSQVDQARNLFYSNHWKPWFKKAPHFQKFWGTLDNQKVIFELSQEGYSHRAASTLEEQALVADDNDLPLMATDPVWKPAMNVIEQRLKGTLKIPHLQDIVTEFSKISTRDNHINHVWGIYKELLYEHLTRNHYEIIYPKLRNRKLIILTRNERTFYIRINQRDLELLTDKEIYVNSDAYGVHAICH